MNNLCDICLTNKAITKGYWTAYEGTDNEQSQSLPTCGTCVCLKWNYVSKLLSKTKEERLKLIKKWWAPGKRSTTLAVAYPGIDWKTVRLA